MVTRPSLAVITGRPGDLPGYCSSACVLMIKQARTTPIRHRVLTLRQSATTLSLQQELKDRNSPIQSMASVSVRFAVPALGLSRGSEMGEEWGSLAPATERRRPNPLSESQEFCRKPSNTNTEREFSRLRIVSNSLECMTTFGHPAEPKRLFVRPTRLQSTSKSRQLDSAGVSC